MLASVEVEEGEGDQPPVTESSSRPSHIHSPSLNLEGTGGSEWDQVQSSHDSPLLNVLCTDLAKGVLALEASKDAQAAEILKLKTRIKKLKKKSHPVISHHKVWLRSVSRLSMKRKLGRKESVSKQGRKIIKPRPTLDAFNDLDADGRDYMEIEDVVKEGRQGIEAEDKGSSEKGGSTKELVSTVIPEIVSTARPDVDAARQEVSVVEPRIPPTTTSIFDDEDITMAQTLIKMKEEKAKEKGVSIKDVEDASRPARSILTLKPLPSIDPKDKGNGILVEEEPVKIKGKDQGTDQIERDAKLAHKLHEEELAEIARIQEEKAAQEEASKAAIAEMYDEVQPGIDVDALFAAKLQQEEREEYTIEERVKFLAKTILKAKSFEEIKGMYERQKKSVQDFVLIGSAEDKRMIEKMNKKAAGVDEEEVLEEPDSTKVEVKQEERKESTRKRSGKRLKIKAIKKSKRKKTDSDLEEEEQ
ncbi:hypothetical protein Tco_1520366, partial [Tanacetum coccineum]